MFDHINIKSLSKAELVVLIISKYYILNAKVGGERIIRDEKFPVKYSPNNPECLYLSMLSSL